LLARVTLLCCIVASPGPALAGTGEASRAHTAVTVGQKTVTADSSVKYTGYVPGEKIPVALEYSGACNIVFNLLSLFTPIPFSPPRIVTGEIRNVSGAPSGLARLNLALGVDNDCDLAISGWHRLLS
jgi:hypothetical protein